VLAVSRLIAKASHLFNVLDILLANYVGATKGCRV